MEPRLRVLARSSLRAEVARLVARSSAETLCRAARGGCAPGCARGCVHNQGALKPEQPACTTKKRCAPSTAQRPSFRSQSNSCVAQPFSPCADFFFIGLFFNTIQYMFVGGGLDYIYPVSNPASFYCPWPLNLAYEIHVYG